MPGIVLMIGIGGLHTAALILGIRNHRLFILAAVAGGYELIVWIVVQMMIIPFSWLQIGYAAAGLSEVGLAIVALGVFPPQPLRTER